MRQYVHTVWWQYPERVGGLRHCLFMLERHKGQPGFTVIPYRRILATGLILAVAAFGAMANASVIGLFDADDESATLLDLRIASMREVQHALATPIPAPDPLPRITAWPAHALKRTLVTQHHVLPTKRGHHFGLSRAAREAMAAVEPAPERRLRRTIPSYSYPPFDRHAVR